MILCLLVGWAIHFALAVWILEQKSGERGQPELSKKGKFLPWNQELKWQVSTGSTNVSNMKYIYYTSIYTEVYEKYNSNFIAIVYFNVNVWGLIIYFACL